MKNIIVVLVYLATSMAVNAQSVGIGTNSPNSSAQLDITSTSKGFLTPRMTTVQRTAIASPATGLMVYDTNLSGFYFYNGSSWSVLSGGGGASPWSVSGTHIYNSNTGNVGIGINAPTSKFHVLGDVLLENGSIKINDINPAVSLISGGLTKGFIKMQSSTGNMSIGTQVLYNDEGKLQLETKSFPRITIMPGGNVGVGTINPGYKLDVVGDIKADGNLRLDDGYIRMYNTADTKNWQLQYSSSSNRMLFLENGFERFVWQNGGNIGIGGNLPLSASFPLAKLHVETGEDAGLTANNNGFIMIGPGSGTNIVIDNNEIVARNGFTTASSLYLQNNGGELISGARFTVNKDGEGLRLNGNNPQMNFYQNNVFKSFISQSADGLYMGVNGGNLRLDATGQIAIGSVIPAASGYKLTVTGKVICEELKVQLRAAWPDYVFGNEYKLKPLQELEQFIGENKHLPNIPSAAEVEKNGIEIGAMQKRMMEKIEELTLYVIELQKQVDSLKSNSK